MTIINKILLLLTFAISFVQSARILGVFPLPARSHYFLGNALMRGLAQQGHDVTIISAFHDNSPAPQNGTYTEIILPGILEEVQKRQHEINLFEIGDMNPFISTVVLATIMSESGEMILKQPEMQQFLKSAQQFDAVIVEQFYNDAHKALAHHFNAPLIIFNTIGANYWVNPLVANPAPPSYVPDSMLSYSSAMTFCERTINTLIYLLNNVVFHTYVFPLQMRAVEQYMPNPPSNFDGILYNASLVLLNSHSSIDQAVPHVPNMVEIGGFHIKPAQKLPKDLQDYLDSAKDGAIYFSFGSNLKSMDLPQEKREAIIKSFGKLKQKILFKWENDTNSIPSQPANVKISKWFPQNDILAHENIKLFVTHGGLLSTIEAVNHGVPVLAIPIYGDQKLNAQKAVRAGFGLSVPFKELNEEKLGQALEELLNNLEYRKNARVKSKLFHDRPNKPIDLATYWVEYVVRHKGAEHLRVAGLDLPWYQYHLLDVIAVIAIGGVSWLILSLWLAKVILFWLLCRSERHDLKKLKEL